MSNFTETLEKIEAIENAQERLEVSNFYVINHLRENDCCISSEDWGMILYYDYDPWCLMDEVTEHWTDGLKRKIAKVWWDEFENIETDDEGMITTPFMFWSEGNSQFDIMEAFKDFFDVDVIEDKEFMGQVGFAKGEALMKKQEERKTTIFFLDGEQADVFHHGNDYSIYFHNGDCSVRGALIDIMREIEKYKEKITAPKATNNRPDMMFDEDDHFMVSSGNYLNYWTTEASYDVFIIFHELQIHQHEEVCEKVVHQIMAHRKVSDTKEKLAKRIQTALEALVDWEENEPYVFIAQMKGSDD